MHDLASGGAEEGKFLGDAGGQGLADVAKNAADAACEVAHGRYASQRNHGESERILDQVLAFFAVHQTMDRSVDLEHQLVHFLTPISISGFVSS